MRLNEAGVNLQACSENKWEGKESWEFRGQRSVQLCPAGRPWHLFHPGSPLASESIFCSHLCMQRKQCCPPGWDTNNLLNRSAFGSRGCSFMDRGKEASWSCPWMHLPESLGERDVGIAFPCCSHVFLSRGLWASGADKKALQVKNCKLCSFQW